MEWIHIILWALIIWNALSVYWNHKQFEQWKRAVDEEMTLIEEVGNIRARILAEEEELLKALEKIKGYE